MRIPHWYQAEWFFKDGQLRETAKAFLREIFQEQVEREDSTGCWLFRSGVRRKAGYHSITWMGGQMPAHRLAYQLFKGDIPVGLHVLHSCDNPPCVNPDHLRAGTQRENMRDRLDRGRFRNGQNEKTHCPQGHEYTHENTYGYEGRRYCRACHKEYSTRYARNLQATNPELKRERLRQWRTRKKVAAE